MRLSERVSVGPTTSYSVGLVYIRMGIYNVFILLENFVLGTSIYKVFYNVFSEIPLKNHHFGGMGIYKVFGIFENFAKKTSIYKVICTSPTL